MSGRTLCFDDFGILLLTALNIDVFASVVYGSVEQSCLINNNQLSVN